MDYLINNLGTIAALLVVVAVVIIAVAVMRRDKKKGVSMCGGSCQNCSMGCCNARKEKKSEQ